MTTENQKSYVINEDELPDLYPTHVHDAEFWESLGRSVAAFGFLEEILAKAIYALTGTREVNEQDAEDELNKWMAKLERSLSDQLGGLIDTYGKAAREHPSLKIDNIDELVEDLRSASRIRNVICHGSWRKPNENGQSKPFFVNRQQEIFDTDVGVDFLNQLREHTKCLICAVVNSVTTMGIRFPSSNGPGEKL